MNFTKKCISFLAASIFYFVVSPLAFAMMGNDDDSLKTCPRASYGPSGGGGSAFHIVNPEPCRIVQIKLHTGTWLDNIEVLCRDKQGNIKSLGKAGGTGGNPNIITLGQDEILTGIYGRAGSVVDSLYFTTNKRGSIKGFDGSFSDWQPSFSYSGREVISVFGTTGTRWWHDVVASIGIETLLPCSPPPLETSPPPKMCIKLGLDQYICNQHICYFPDSTGEVCITPNNNLSSWSIMPYSSGLGDLFMASSLRGAVYSLMPEVVKDIGESVGYPRIAHFVATVANLGLMAYTTDSYLPTLTGLAVQISCERLLNSPRVTVTLGNAAVVVVNVAQNMSFTPFSLVKCAIAMAGSCVGSTLAIKAKDWIFSLWKIKEMEPATYTSFAH